MLRRRLFPGAATLVALLTSLVLVAGATPASAATATLSIAFQGCQNSQGTNFDYTLRVQGSTRLYANGYRVDVRLWGDDSFSDDFILGPVSQSRGGGFSGYLIDICVNSSDLDEDIGTDEIYAGVRVFDLGTGANTEVVESNRIEGNF